MLYFGDYFLRDLSLQFTILDAIFATLDTLVIAHSKALFFKWMIIIIIAPLIYVMSNFIHNINLLV